MKTSSQFALRDWQIFVRSKTFCIGGIGAPIVIAALLWFFVLYQPSHTADSVNRWEHFQSELKRFKNDVQGKYTFELSDDRFVYYVDDSSDLQLAKAVRQEILRRDIESFLEYVNSSNQPVWKSWFSEAEHDLTNHFLLLTRTPRLSPDEFIEYFSIKQDSSRSYLLESPEQTSAWFVDGWNDNVKKIARRIPKMSFATYVEIIDPNEEWLQSGVIAGYFRMSEQDLRELGRAYLLLKSTSDFTLASETRKWYQDLANDVQHELYQNPSINREITESIPSHLSFVIGLTTETSINFQPSETQALARRVYSAVFLFAVFGCWSLLYFDRNLRMIEKSIPTLFPSIVDGRVLGMTLKVVTFVAIWFVVLFVPLFGIVGSSTGLGLGSLGLFFNPLFLLHWWFFFTLGIMTFGYFSHVMSVWRKVPISLNFFVLLLVMAVWLITLPSIENFEWTFFLPIFGLYSAIGQTTEPPELPMYLPIVIGTVVYFFLCRKFLIFAETRARSKEWVKFTYVKL